MELGLLGSIAYLGCKNNTTGSQALDKDYSNSNPHKIKSIYNH